MTTTVRTTMEPWITSPPARAASASVRHGATLTFETIGPGLAPVRVRPSEDVLLRVIAGVIVLTVDGEERWLDPGDEAIVPAGAAHRLAGYIGEARVVMGFRAA